MLNPDIKLAAEIITARSASYAHLYDYYSGRHALTFSSQKFRNKFGRQLQSLRQNLCKTVVMAPASRLEVIGFLSEAGDIRNAAWEIWKNNGLPRNAGKIHREAFRTGNAYAIVWPDAEGRRAKIFPQSAASVAVWTSVDTGETEKAAKMWTATDKNIYLNLYYPDRIEKYVSIGGSMKFDQRQVDGEAWPLPNSFGRVPVFHFRFDEELSDLGNSILTDVIPLNDALNKSYADIFAAQEVNAIRQRWISGIQFEQDEETGKDLVPYDFDSQAWTSRDEATRFGEFSDANLAQMLAVKQECVKDIALVSGIPPSYFNLEQTGSAISGEALRKIEARFTAIVQESQRCFGETWARLMAFALEIENSRVTGETAVEVQWTDAAPVSETELLDNAQKKKNLGWSVEQLQRDLGLTDRQIAAMEAENANRLANDVSAKARFFDAGGLSMP